MTIPTARAAPHPLPLLDDQKHEARLSALAVRAQCDPSVGTELVGLIRPLVPSGAVVAGFWPLPGEIDIRPVLQALHEAGHCMALPETPRRGQPLSFRLWQPGVTLHPGRFGTLVPDGPVVTPTLLLVPLLAFDRHGRRLGYGGGYYDRTIAALPGIATIGCAFARQEVPAVPYGPTDLPLGAIATECGLIPLRT